MALVLALTATLAAPGAAYAEPLDAETADPPDETSVTMDWPALGLGREIYLGPDSSTSFSVPVPAGLNAVRLQGVIAAPLNIDAGYLEIDDVDGNLLSVVDLPPVTSAQAMTPFDVDISAAPAQADTVELSFTARALDDADQFCGPRQQLIVSGLRTVFAGVESPATTIANFFPPVLERATIYAPTGADAAEQQSVLTLVATLTRLYHPQRLDIGVVTQPRGATPPPAGRLTRAILVENGGAAGLRVENPGTPDSYLRFSGSGDELTTQVSLLTAQLQSLAQTPGARVDQAQPAPLAEGDTLTFSQLNMSGRTNVLRTGNLTVSADRSALGTGRVSSVQVHLLADYTPVPTADSASVVVRSNDVVVYRAPLDSTGRLDATFDVDGPAFGQWISLDLALAYTPQQTCGPFIAPIDFQIDPRSTLTMTRGGPPLDGFGAVPSEFAPGFLVALDGTSPDQLSYAARTIGAIARLTTAPLTPRVVDLRTAADATSGALIVAESQAIEQTSLNPPVVGQGTEVGLGLPTELRADIEGGLGSIQAFADRPRDRSVVLVTTTASWALVNPLFGFIEDSDGGWSQLTGDVLAAGAAGVASNVAIRAGTDVFEVPTPASASSPGRWIPIGIAVAVVVVGAAALAAFWSVRRRRERGSATGD